VSVVGHMRQTNKHPVCGTNFATFGPIHARIGPFVCLDADGGEPSLEPLSSSSFGAASPRPRIASSGAIAVVWSVGRAWL
jgi:hypothetical protein